MSSTATETPDLTDANPDTHLGEDNPEQTPSAYYVRKDGTHFFSTLHTQGAWNPHEQHMAPASGLLVHAINTNHPREDVQLSQVTFEILGLIHGGLIEVTTEVIRPGRTIELIQATMSHNGRPAIRAFAWRLIKSDTADVAGTHLNPLPAPDTCEDVTNISDIWPGGFIRSLKFKKVASNGPGNGTAWLSTPYPLVLGEKSEANAAFMGLIDTANGIAVRQNPRDWLFPNVDLTVHLFRQPRHGWVGLDTRVSWGETGAGLTASDLYDEDGPIGRVAQILTLRRNEK